MKQMLKEIMILWIRLILILASVSAVIGVPSLIFTYAGIGEWQVIVSIIWLFLVLAVSVIVEKNKGSKEI